MSSPAIHSPPLSAQTIDANAVQNDQREAVASQAAAPVAPAPTIPPPIWAEKINNAFGFSTGWIIKAGELLAQAKKQLGHGQWSSLFQPGMLKFGLRTAEMLMEIARHPSFRESKNFSSLPNAWSTLHALRKLPVELVEQAIADGVIHSEMKLAEAQQLVRTVEAGTEQPQRRRALLEFNPARERKRLIDSLRLQAARWPSQYRKELAEVLQATALELLNQGNPGSL